MARFPISPLSWTLLPRTSEMVFMETSDRKSRVAVREDKVLLLFWLEANALQGHLNAREICRKCLHGITKQHFFTEKVNLDLVWL